MKKTALLFALLISALAKAQTTDYRTTEDGINQLINNAGFLDKMSNMSNEQIATTTLDKLFDEFVPEYKGFKADVNNLNLNNIYFTPDAGGDYSPKQLAGGFGKLLGMKDDEVNAFQSIFDGNYQEVDLRTASSQLGNSLYNRGKNEGVDYVVDKTNNFLQEQYGSNEGNSVRDWLLSQMHQDGGFCVGSGIFCASLSKYKPENYYVLWSDDYFKYIQRFKERGWDSTVTWIEDSEDLSSCLNRLRIQGFLN